MNVPDVCCFRQPGDDNKMLVCDTCDKGYHTFCLKPVMTTIPKNGWKCKVSTHIVHNINRCWNVMKEWNVFIINYCKPLTSASHQIVEVELTLRMVQIHS